MKPWMSNKDIKLIEQEIIKLNKKHITVLEWGSGGSTKYFTDFMTKHGITYRWESVEYNKAWAKKIQSLNIPNTRITLFDVGNDNLQQRKTNMDEYICFPLSLNARFDIILVDGRKRRRCLINASYIVKENGIVLLHDAQRVYYHCAFAKYARHKFLSKELWVGHV